MNPEELAQKRVLIVEDDPSDLELFLESVNRSGFPLQVSVVRNGADALKFLFREGAFAEAPAPDLIFLDLNLPQVDGRGVLERIKNDPRVAHIPVIIFSTSSSEKDIVEAYGAKANCFITKPSDLDQYFNTIKEILNFWFCTARLPAL